MKELPYFRFTIQEWQNGDITLQKDGVQGVFINICSYYWSQNCRVALARLKLRFPTKQKEIKVLLDTAIIKKDGDFIAIDFLDSQLNELQKTSKFLSECGKKGYEAKLQKAKLKGSKKPPSKPPLSNKIIEDKDKDKDKDLGKMKTYENFFDEFWKIYPTRKGKKIGKARSFTNFCKIAIPFLTTVIANAKNYGMHNEFPKDPERFLLNDFWKDWNEPQEPEGKKQVGVQRITPNISVAEACPETDEVMGVPEDFKFRG